MKMETAGSLRDGKEIWGLAKLKDDFELAGGDEVKGYLLINQPHEAGKAMTIKFTPIRVVCNNTLTMALRGEGTALRMPHVKEFDEDVRAAAEEALGLSSQAITDFKEKSEFLASRQYKQESVLNYIAELYQPSVLVDKAKALTDDEFVMQEQFNATGPSKHRSKSRCYDEVSQGNLVGCFEWCDLSRRSSEKAVSSW